MRWLVAVAAVSMLAGCSQDPRATDPADDLQATPETGIIRGVVVDPAILPISGVNVTVAGRSLLTDENGTFGFDGLSPGVHVVVASKAGFSTVQSSTNVEAGVQRPRVVRIMLEPDPVTAPFVQPFHFKGHMGCSLSYIALCGLPGLSGATNDDFLAVFPLERPPQWINMESVWDGTQPTGNQMNLNMGRTPAGPATTCATAQGPSPLLITLDDENITAEDCGIGRDGDLVGRMFAWEMEGTNIRDLTGYCIPAVLTTYCQGPGMALQQDFELFVHAFYNWVPVEGWRFTDHGEPEPPA